MAGKHLELPSRRSDEWTGRGLDPQALPWIGAHPSLDPAHQKMVGSYPLRKDEPAELFNSSALNLSCEVEVAFEGETGGAAGAVGGAGDAA